MIGDTDPENDTTDLRIQYVSYDALTGELGGSTCVLPEFAPDLEHYIELRPHVDYSKKKLNLNTMQLEDKVYPVHSMEAFFQQYSSIDIIQAIKNNDRTILDKIEAIQ